MPQTVSMLSADSVIAWELESAFKTAPAAAAWRPLGELPEFSDLGPVNALSGDLFAGSGREVHRITPEGRSFAGPLGPFAVVDPLLLALWWGQEVSAPAQIGATPYYRHTATPTNRGRLTSLALQMRDKQGGAEAVPQSERNTYLGCVINKLSLRGERPADDGSGGKAMAMLDLLAMKDDPNVADKTGTLLDKAPYRYSHARLNFWGEQVYRVAEWEFTGDNQASVFFAHQDSDADYPYDVTHDGAIYRPFRATIVADGEKFTTDGQADKRIFEIARDRLKGNVTLRYIRTLDQDEFQVNLTDLVLTSALKRRARQPGAKVEYAVLGVVRTSTFQWVDQTAAKILPA